MRQEELPAIRREAAEVGATIWFADEAGIRSDYHAGTTWAPVGDTPVVKKTGARHSINLVLAVAAQGAPGYSPKLNSNERGCGRTSRPLAEQVYSSVANL